MKTLYFISLIFIIGCGPTVHKFNKLSLGMSKSQAIEAIGKPDSFRAAKYNESNQPVEVFEYHEYETKSDRFLGTPSYYWLQFIDNKLYGWGRAGDWKKDPEPAPLISSDKNILQIQNNDYRNSY